MKPLRPVRPIKPKLKDSKGNSTTYFMTVDNRWLDKVAFNEYYWNGNEGAEYPRTAFSYEELQDLIKTLDPNCKISFTKCHADIDDNYELGDQLGVRVYDSINPENQAQIEKENAELTQKYEAEYSKYKEDLELYDLRRAEYDLEQAQIKVNKMKSGFIE